MLRQVFRLALDLKFVENFGEDAALFFNRRRDTVELERDRDSHLLAFFDRIKIGMERRARDCIKIHFMDQRVLGGAKTLQLNNRRLSCDMKKLAEFFGV